VQQVRAAAGVATFDSPDRGVRAISYVSQRLQLRDLMEGSQDATLSEYPRPSAIDRHVARAYIDQRTSEAADMLSEARAKGLLAAYSLQTITPYLVRSSSKAMAIGRQIGSPSKSPS
jgi:acyl-CoA synthetase (NDP forming)